MSNNIPGLVKPTQVGMIGSNPKDSAAMSLNNMNQKQTSLSNAVGGKKMRKKYGGSTTNTSSNSTTSAIPVPQYNMPYQPQNGPGQDPNSQIVQNSINGTQGSANAVYDSQATKLTGGKRTRKSKKHNKSRKSKKHTKSRKHRKTISKKDVRK